MYMKIRESYQDQQERKQKNEHRVLSALDQEGPLTFTQLQQKTGLSSVGLIKILARLVQNEKIFKPKDDRMAPYQIKKSGTSAKDLLYLGYTVDELKSNDAKYYIDYSDNIQSEHTKYDLPFGILSHLFLHKDIGKLYNPFLKKDIFEFEANIFKKIKDNIKNKKINLIKLKDDTGKKIVIAFEFDYNKIIKKIDELSEKEVNDIEKTRLRELKQ